MKMADKYMNVEQVNLDIGKRVVCISEACKLMM